MSNTTMAIHEITRHRLKSLVKRHKTFGKYLVWLKRSSKRDISETTLEIKFNNLTTLMNNYGLEMNGDASNILDVAEKVANAKLATATRNLYRLALRQWSEFRKIELDEDTAEAIKDKRAGNETGPRKLTNGDLISWEEFSDIRAHTKDPSLDAYLALLYDMGSRPGETVALNVGDVCNTDAGYVISFSHGVKNKHSLREVILGVVNERCNTIFGKWFEQHPLKDKPEAPLFLNREGGRLAQDVATHRLKYHNERLDRGRGTNKAALHLYLFRKSSITLMLRQKRLTEIEIKLRIGHARNSAVLETYYDFRDAEDQEKAQKKAKGIVAPDDDFSRLTCDRCDTLNEVGIDVCEKCSYPLTADARKREYDAQKKRLSEELSEEFEGQRREMELRMDTLEDATNEIEQLKFQLGNVETLLSVLLQALSEDVRLKKHIEKLASKGVEPFIDLLSETPRKP